MNSGDGKRSKSSPDRLKHRLQGSDGDEKRNNGALPLQP
jgi:hypothetical protein